MSLDLKGKRFGRLLVVGRVPPIPGARNAFWQCVCDCGNKTKVAASNLGKTTLSCGCYAKETAAVLLSAARYTQTHAMSHTPEHDAWIRMKQRCANPKDKKYYRYGARGINVCARWLSSFENFLFDMGKRPSPRHSINRIDNDGNYTPKNCNWATPVEQIRNRSITTQVWVTGVRLPVAEWCEIYGIKRDRLKELTRARDGRKPKFGTVQAAVVHLHAKLKLPPIRKSR